MQEANRPLEWKRSDADPFEQPARERRERRERWVGQRQPHSLVRDDAGTALVLIKTIRRKPCLSGRSLEEMTMGGRERGESFRGKKAFLHSLKKKKKGEKS